MKTWTDAAKDRLDAHLAQRAAREGLTGDEAAEVMEDWRMHVHEELEQESAVLAGHHKCKINPIYHQLGRK